MKVPDPHEESSHCEELLRAFAQMSNIGLASVNVATGLLVMVNPALCEMLGYEENELVGQPFTRFHHPDEIPKVQAEFLEAVATRRKLKADCRLIRRDGNEIVARFNVGFVASDDGDGLITIAAVEDITPQRLREQELRYSEERLADAMAIARMGNWSWDVIENVIWWSRPEYKIFALDPDEFTPEYEKFLSLLHPDDRASVEARVDAVRRGHNEYEYDARIIRPSGEVRWIHTIARVERDSQGRFSRLLGTDQDITQRKLDEEKLHDSERQLQQLADAMPQVVWIADAMGRIVYHNRRGDEIFGGENCVNPSWMLHPEDGLRTKIEWDRCHRERIPFEVELRLKTTSNEYRWYLIRGVPVLANDGSIERWYGAATDIHHLRETESQLREQREQFWQSQKMEAIGRLAGGVAHDFNNLLTIVLGECELLLSNPPKDNAALHRSLVAIRDAGSRASALTKQLLTFGRRDQSPPQRIDLNSGITAVRHLLDRLGGDAIVLKYSLANETPWVLIDITHLEQILFNLVSNAVDAMPNGGVVEIRTRVNNATTIRNAQKYPSGTASIAVVDSGVGVSAEVCEKLFEPFFTTKEFGRGTGLGLAVVHGIAERLGGEVTFSSIENKTTFTVTFPLG